MKASKEETAELAGVRPETLRRWEKTGLIEVERTPTNQLLYDVGQLMKIKTMLKKDYRLAATMSFTNCQMPSGPRLVPSLTITNE